MELAIMAGILLFLVVAGVVADYILPHIKPLNEWLSSLPLAQVVDADYEIVEEEESEKSKAA